MIKFTGDFAVLERFEARLNAAPKAFETVKKNLAEETVDLVRGTFEKSSDPYGERWEPLKVRSGKPLEDTGGLKGSYHPQITADGFSVGSGKDYAGYHQDGTGVYGRHKSKIRPEKAKALRIPGVGFRASVKGTPARKMVPDDRGLPPAWSDSLVDVAELVLTRHFDV